MQLKTETLMYFIFFVFSGDFLFDYFLMQIFALSFLGERVSCHATKKKMSMDLPDRLFDSFRASKSVDWRF